MIEENLLLDAQRAQEERSELNEKRRNHNEKIESQNRSALKDYGRFYTSLGTLSGAAIVLSLSLLDYFDDLERHALFLSVDNINLLQLSWLFFAITIGLTLTYVKRGIDTFYWVVVEDHAEYNEKDDKNKLRLIKHGLLTVIDGSAEREKEVSEQNMQHWKKQKEVAIKKRKSAQNWIGNSAQFIHISFALGILFLVLFAVSTLGL